MPLRILFTVLVIVLPAAPSLGSAQSLNDFTTSPAFLTTTLPRDEDEGPCERAPGARPAPPGNIDAMLRQIEPEESTNPYKQRLLNVLNSLTPRSASGTTPALLTSPGGEGALFHAFFYPLLKEGDTRVAWTGYLQGLFVDRYNNLREDTDGDGRLVLERDAIVRIRFDALSRELVVDRFNDLDGNGLADTAVPFHTANLRDIQPLWEAGTRLALRDPSERRIITWVDLDNDRQVTGSEVIAFAEEHALTLAPFLRAGPEPYTADNLIRFVRGEQVPKLRNRALTLGESSVVWRLGDPMHSSPVVVGPPKERYDVLYGDPGYAEFFRRYRHRRQVVYMGANDGMLHAFNAGFYHSGDDPATEQTEQGWFSRSPFGDMGGQPLGDERWAFIPFELLPHLQWLARPDYGHVYYVDLKPKVTDVRIFTPDEDHPGGWGTILIGGFRMGGSCAACKPATGGAPMTVRADFGNGIETRTFYTAYFALDITNPERDPVLLWSFSDEGLGLGTASPAIVRVAPEPGAGRKGRTGARSGSGDATGERWFMVVGSGPTGYDGGSSQEARLYAVDLKTGPVDPGGLSSVVRFETGQANAFLGEATAVDVDLDFRVDTLYVGSAARGGGNVRWTGTLYRLQFGGRPDPFTWGIASGGDRMPSVLLATLPPRVTPHVDLLMTPSDPAEVPVTYGFVGDELQELTFEILEDPLGPITSAPTVGLDERGQVWVFAGTGRFYGALDKTNSDPQYVVGVKDPVVRGDCLEYSKMSCERRQLIERSDLVGLRSGETGPRPAGSDARDALAEQARHMDGWYRPLPAPRERVLVSPTLIGGVLFVPTFIPTNTTCGSSGYAYLLQPETGLPASRPVLTIHHGPGDPRSPAVPLGPSGVVTGITVNPIRRPPASPRHLHVGCRDWSLGFIQSSFGPVGEVCAAPANRLGSRMLSWLNHRHG